VARATCDSLSRIDLSTYSVAGLSVGALQLSSSLYAVRLLKTLKPELTIVLGGSGLVGEVAENLLEAEPGIDFIVSGEGEEALLKLATLNSHPKQFAQVPNLWYRAHDGRPTRTSVEVIPELDALPIPDYSDYLQAADRWEYPESLIVLPVEASRGCAWEHRCGHDELKGCTFCGLYRNSPSYREKSRERVVREIEHLICESRILDIAFVDAYLPDSYREQFLKDFADSLPDATLFCELRCNLTEEVARLLNIAGTRKVQLGVESFHTGILSRMEKGTRTIDNLYSLKLCEEWYVPYQYNLITHIPGVPRIEIEQMAQLLPSLFGFRPPGIAEFYLDRGSRIFKTPQEYGLAPQNIDEPVTYLPRRLAGRKVTQFVPFRESENDAGTREAWQSIVELVAVWRQVHGLALRSAAPNGLSYRVGPGFTVISDRRTGETRRITLEGEISDVFLACISPIPEHRLKQNLIHLQSTRIDEILALLAAEKLIFRESQHLLALPSHEKVSDRRRDSRRTAEQ